MRECGKMESKRGKAYGDHLKGTGVRDSGKETDKMENVHSNTK